MIARLTEFEDTPSSKLTIEEFHNIDLEEDQDPPCFTEGKKRSKLVQVGASLQVHISLATFLQAFFFCPRV